MYEVFQADISKYFFNYAPDKNVGQTHLDYYLIPCSFFDNNRNKNRFTGN